MLPHSTLPLPPRLLGGERTSLRRYSIGSGSSWTTGRGATRPRSRLNQLARRHPILLFGFPFCTLMVVGSFLLTEFTQTRYDLRARRATKVTQETQLRLEADKRPLSLQEEYWRLAQQDDEDSGTGDAAWEVKRIERPEEAAL